MFYKIELHQAGGDSQTEFTSESLEEITQHWEQLKGDDDAFDYGDEEITLRQSTDNWETNDEMIQCYPILNSQRGVDEMNYMVRMEDETQEKVLGKFNALEEATASFNEHVAKAKENLEDYFGSRDGWDIEEPPYIAIETLDSEGFPYAEKAAFVATE